MRDMTCLVVQACGSDYTARNSYMHVVRQYRAVPASLCACRTLTQGRSAGEVESDTWLVCEVTGEVRATTEAMQSTCKAPCDRTKHSKARVLQLHRGCTGHTGTKVEGCVVQKKQNKLRTLQLCVRLPAGDVGAADRAVLEARHTVPAAEVSCTSEERQSVPQAGH